MERSISMFKKLSNQNVLVSLFLLSVFLLALNKVSDTDAWMHLGFGRLLWELKAFPANEPFVYPSIDMPFSYSSWLFGITYYLTYLAFNIYGVVLLKAITVTTAFYILLKDSLRPHKNYIISIVVMTMIVIMARHRFVERPDTFLMVFLSFSIFSLNAFVYDNKKYIYALPVIHMLWANSHSSINLMFVPFLSFIAGGVIQRHIGSRFTVHGLPSASQLKTIALIFALSFAASLISPYFISQYLFGSQFLSSPWFKQEIIELKAPTWETAKWPYVITAALVLSFVLNWVAFYRTRKKTDNSERSTMKGELSLVHLFLVLPFVVLSFTAMRFVFLLGIVAGPVLARNISAILEGHSLWNRLSNKKIMQAFAGIWIVIYTSLTFANVEPFEDPTKTFGFGINYNPIPEGALKFMDRNGITGRVFNLFQWGGYIVWRDFPKRAVFVDPRGYLPADLLEKVFIVGSRPSVLDDLHEKYGFEAVLIGYPAVEPSLSQSHILSGADVALSHQGWSLVYWDDLSLLYLKRGGKYSPVIRENAYDFVKPANGASSTRPGLHDENHREKIINEMKRNIRETGSSKAYAFLGFAYNEIGLYKDAIESFSMVRNLPFPLQNHIIDAYNGMAYAYARLGNLDKAIGYYNESLDRNKDATTFYNLGITYIAKGNEKAAIKYLSKALELNRNLTSIYPKLADIYSRLGMEDKARKTEQMFKTAEIAKEGEEHFRKGVRAYLEKKLDIAEQEFRKSIEANPSNPTPYSNLGYVYFDLGMIDKAFEYQKRAIDIDPDFANAHYGVALIYKKWAQTDLAKKHWGEYLRIEPEGYFSRKAKEEIETLQ
jgi:pentatricopeptide repeat protein